MTYFARANPIHSGSLRASRAAFWTGAAALALISPAMALAQSADEAQPAADAAAEEEMSGNEIVVTATKREQTLQEVPVAVSVTSAMTIERAQIRDLKDLTTVVPSLRVTERQNSANASFLIRGFGNGANNAGIEPSVGVFVDGVYRSRSAASISDLPDIQRVEVLRGPQSTLFGKNASAGVISIVTQLPKFDFGGNVEASYGNYNALVLKGVVTGPLSETVAASLAAGYNRRDGVVQNLGTGNDITDRNRWFIRGQLLFQGDSGLKVRLIGDYNKIDELCCGVFSFQQGLATSVLTSPLIGGKVNAPGTAFDNNTYFNFDPTNKIENYGVSGQIDYDIGPLTLTSITAYRKSKTATNFDTDFTSADLLRGANIGFTDIKTFTQEIRLQANFVDKINVLLGGFYFNEKVAQGTNVTWGTKARTFADTLVRSLSGGAQNIALLEGTFGTLTGNPARYTNQFFAAGQGLTEDDRLDNENFSIFSQIDFQVTDRLTLTGGINYTNDKKRYIVNLVSTDVYGALDIPALRNTATSVGIAQTVAGFFGLPAGSLASAAQIGQFAQANPAGFAQIQAGAAAATAPLLGLRPLQFIKPILGIPNSLENGRTSDDKFTYTARLAYDVSDNLNTYVSYSTGYKASSINLSRDSRPPASLAAAIQSAGIGVVNQDFGTRFAPPENASVYEFGLKGSWRNASFSAAVFHQSIKGFQSNIFTGTGFFLGSAGKQSVRGFEIEGMVKPAKGFTISGGLTYLDPKYDDYKNSAFGDASGTRPADIPEVSFTLGAEYEHELANNDRIIARLSFHHESKVQVVEGLPAFSITNPLTGAVNFQPGLDAAKPYTRQVDELEGSISYAMNNGLELTVWARNLTNDRYISTVFDSPAQQGSVSGYTNQPRTFGGSVRYRF
jgi:outer membrane receptor protein involved in Fe transport